MTDVRDMEIGALKFGQVVQMHANVAVALHRVERAIIHGSLHCTMQGDDYAKLSAAKALLEELDASLARRRKTYGEE